MNDFKIRENGYCKKIPNLKAYSQDAVIGLYLRITLIQWSMILIYEKTFKCCLSLKLVGPTSETY